MPHAFSGDDETTCTVDGVAHDFNLIVRRGVARPALAVQRLGEGERLACESGAATLIHVLVGGLTALDGVRLDSGDARVGRSVDMPEHRAERDTVVLVATLS